MSQVDDYKTVILARFCGEFLQADEKTANIRKTSEEIVVELRPAAEFTTDEVSAHLVSMSYQLGFDDMKPVWLMRKGNENELPEH